MGPKLDSVFRISLFLKCLGFQINDVLLAPSRRCSYQSSNVCHFDDTLGAIWSTAGFWFHIWRLNCTFVQCSSQDRLVSSQYSSCWLSVIRWALCNYLLLTEHTHKRPHQINEAFEKIISQSISQQNISQSLHLDWKKQRKEKNMIKTLFTK